VYCQPVNQGFYVYVNGAFRAAWSAGVHLRRTGSMPSRHGVQLDQPNDFTKTFAFTVIALRRAVGIAKLNFSTVTVGMTGLAFSSTIPGAGAATGFRVALRVQTVCGASGYPTPG